MPHSRTLTVTFGSRADLLYVVGTELAINLSRTAPVGTRFFSVDYSPDVDVHVPQGKKLPPGQKVPLGVDTLLCVSMKEASKEAERGRVTIELFNCESEKLTEAELNLTAFEISLDVDADRDGTVERNSPNKASWEWGPKGYGAILPVNCDSKSGKRPDCEKSYIGSDDELKVLSQMVLRTAGPERLPEGYRLVLHMSAADAKGAQVFSTDPDPDSGWDRPLLLAEGKLSREIRFSKETTFYVRGTHFTDDGFAGLVRVHVSLLQSGSPETAVFTDTVQFRTTPWIMTPNVQEPDTVYVCQTKDNQSFVKALAELVDKAKCKLHLITSDFNHGDRWTQDEMEFGYVQAPKTTYPVVLESPRDRGLDSFPYEQLLAPNFGYVTKYPPRDQVSSLESFGNLEVSPPVTVGVRSYPLGRIIFGGAFPLGESDLVNLCPAGHFEGRVVKLRDAAPSGDQ